MTVRTLKVGEKGVDFSYSKPPASRLRELGFTFVVGYVSPNPAKNLTPQLANSYLAEGLAVLLVWEVGSTTANEGRSSGEKHGTEGTRQVQLFGYPPEVALIAADDTGPSNLPAQQAYMEGFDYTSAHPLGIYGGTIIMQRCAHLSPVMWVCVAAYSWSGATSVNDAIAKSKAIGAHAIQRKSYSIDGKWAVDPNEIINEFKAWSLVGDPSQPVHPTIQQLMSEEDNMYRSNATVMTIDGKDYQPGYVWFELMPGGTGRHVLDINEVVVALGGTEADCVNNVLVRRSNDALLALVPYAPSTPVAGAMPTFDVSLGLDLNAGTASGIAAPRS